MQVESHPAVAKCDEEVGNSFKPEADFVLRTDAVQLGTGQVETNQEQRQSSRIAAPDQDAWMMKVSHRRCFRLPSTASPL